APAAPPTRRDSMPGHGHPVPRGPRLEARGTTPPGDAPRVNVGPRGTITDGGDRDRGPGRGIEAFPAGTAPSARPAVPTDPSSWPMATGGNAPAPTSRPMAAHRNAADPSSWPMATGGNAPDPTSRPMAAHSNAADPTNWPVATGGNAPDPTSRPMATGGNAP